MIPEIKTIEISKDVHIKASIIENGSPTWLIVSHGLGEHRGRHQHIFELFSQYMNICIYDLRGHGESSGKRTWIENFTDYVDDLAGVLSYLKEEYKMTKYSLSGHSMGALITASFLQKISKDENYPEKVYLSSPPVAIPGPLGEIFHLAPMKVIKLLRSLPVTYALPGLVDLKNLSHDGRIVDQYINDPLNSTKVHSKLAFELVSHCREVFSRPLRAKCELYVSVGSEDKIVSPKALTRYFNNVEKQAKVYRIDGAYHEIHHEIERYRKPYFEILRECLLP